MCLFNEAIISLYLYTMFTLCDPQNTIREQTGYMLISIIVVNVVSNFALLILKIYVSIKCKCRLPRKLALLGKPVAKVVPAVNQTAEPRTSKQPEEQQTQNESFSSAY
jgi:hypothetical protein